MSIRRHREMRALSIRQPYAEEILRGIKPIEFRDHTNGVRIGEQFYIYAAAKITNGKSRTGTVLSAQIALSGPPTPHAPRSSRRRF